MAKTATKKKNIKTSIRNRLVAAISMLLIASIMLVTSTYAWFTLSTAPEVKGIDTSVAGNGSLEVALMNSDGSLASITSGRSGTNGGGTVAVTTANNTWGNLITLSDVSYGLQAIDLKPMSVTPTDSGDTKPLAFSRPVFGYDGRIKELDSENMALNSFENATAFSGNRYGVRAIVFENGTEYETYGYVIDLAFRINTTKDDGTTASLKLEKTGKQRVYNGSTEELSSNALETLGKGSYMSFGENSSVPASAIRIAFIKNYGVDSTANLTPELIAFARVDESTGELQLYNYVSTTDNTTDPPVTTITATDVENNVLLAEMNKNTAYQISVVVWLDGEQVKNKDLTSVSEATLNLQFGTDAILIPAVNANLRDNPPAPVTPANNSGNENQQGGENQQSNTPTYTIPSEISADQLTAAIAVVNADTEHTSDDITSAINNAEGADTNVARVNAATAIAEAYNAAGGNMTAYINALNG